MKVKQLKEYISKIDDEATVTIYGYNKSFVAKRLGHITNIFGDKELIIYTDES